MSTSLFFCSMDLLHPENEIMNRVIKDVINSNFFIIYEFRVVKRGVFIKHY